MEACLKCGYERHKEAFSVCDKCGAVQDKVRALLAAKIKEGLAGCDELIALCDGEIKRAGELEAFVENNRNSKADWQTTHLDPLKILRSELEKKKAHIGQLRGHAATFAVNYELNGKLAKFADYLKKYKAEVEQITARLDDLWTSAKYASLNHAAGTPSGFEPPRGPSAKYEALEEVEARVNANRYPSMLFIAGFYKAIGWLFAVVTAVIVLYGFFGGEKNGLGVAVGGLIAGPIICLSLLAFGESIKVGIDIERNTRATREYMRGLFIHGLSGERKS